MGKEHPIIFSTEMVKAILDGRKTMTRRVIKPCSTATVMGKDSKIEQPDWVFALAKCPYGQVGDSLWFKESHKLEMVLEGEEKWVKCTYRADNAVLYYRWADIPLKTRQRLTKIRTWGKWRPARFMYYFLCRISADIVEERVERLQEISIEDIKLEGSYFDSEFAGANAIMNTLTPKLNFINLWDKINGKKYPWLSNPWVWVIKFDNIGVRVK